MKKQFNTLLLSVMASTFLISSVAFAGVEEKKSKKAADIAIATELNKMKQVCGNEAITVNVTWDTYDTVIDNNVDKLKKNSYQKNWVIDHAGERTTELVKSLTRLCEDIDYKEEIAKINRIEITPKMDFDEFNSEFTLDGGVLSVVTGHRMKRSWSDFERKLKPIF